MKREHPPTKENIARAKVVLYTYRARGRSNGAEVGKVKKVGRKYLSVIRIATGQHIRIKREDVEAVLSRRRN